MKRLVMALMTLVFLMSAIFALPACAETVFRDGIEVTLMTDKESYDSMEAINARLAITNTNRYAVQNVSSEITVPDGYVLSGKAEEEHGKLQAGQMQTQEAAVYQADYVPNLPKTGDSSQFGYWTVLLVICIAGVCVLAHNTHARRFLSILLCIAVHSPYGVNIVPAKAQTNESTIIVKKNVAVAGKNVTLTGTVGYDAPTSSAFAMRSTEETPADELVYTTEGTEITIIGYTGSSVSLVIPEYIDGKPVTKIGYKRGKTGKKLTGVDGVRELVLPDTVKTISSNAFEMCENLESVQFSKNLSYIGGMAFVGCTSLKEIDIQTTGDLDFGTYVAENGGTFGRCENLERVSVVCGGNLNLSGATGSGAIYQGAGAFVNCYKLETVYFSAQGDLRVGDCSFLGCGSMTTVELDAKNLAVIGNSAFMKCLNRVDTEISVILPQEARVQISDDAFIYCQMLNKITLLKNVTEIGSYAFGYCGTAVGGLTIMGNRGSYAEEYVEDHNENNPDDIIKFEAVEDACDHYDAIYNKKYYYNPISSTPYYGWDADHDSQREEGHQIGYLNNRCCKQCNAVIAYSIVLYGDTLYPHEMVNGVCTKCSYAEKSKKPASIVGFALDEDSVTVSNSVHVKSGMAYGGDYYLKRIQISVFTDNSGNHGYYSNVSKEFAYGEATSYDLSGIGAIAINEHFECNSDHTEEVFPGGEALVMAFVSVYNEDGTAGENTFGADAADTVVVSCAHLTYTDVYNENIPIRYTDNNDGKTHIWQSGYDRICNTCHENMGVVYGKENTADHDYTNGDVCPCGYDRSNCQHTPSEIKTYNRHLFAPLDEKQHQTTAIVWNMVCSTCGKTYEEIDTVGDENNPIGLPYDHEWEDGKCKVVGCEYACLHPEKNADGSDNYRDEYLGTVSLTDNGDGVMHHHVYNVKRTCLLCEHSWTVTIDDLAEKHTIRYLDEAGEYKHDTNEHWLEVPEGCSCGYRTGKTEIRNKEEHKPQVTSTDYRYDPDGDFHQIWKIEMYSDCVCGLQYEDQSAYMGFSGHYDRDSDGKCDACKMLVRQSVANPDSFYENPIMTYIYDKADITQEFLDQLECKTSNIAYQNADYYYGGMQHGPMKNVEAMLSILIEHGIIPKLDENTSRNDYDLKLKIAEKYFEILNEQGCLFAALSNSIFEEFRGREEDFYSTFGYPMYVEGHLNHDAVLVDFFCDYVGVVAWTFNMKLIIDEHTDWYNSGLLIYALKLLGKDEVSVGEVINSIKNIEPDKDENDARCNAWIEFCKKHGVQCKVEDVDGINIERVKTIIGEGGNLILGFQEGLQLRNENGVSVHTTGAGHAVTVTGVYHNNEEWYVVVSSWGRPYLVSWNDIVTKNPAMSEIYVVSY